MRDHLDLIKELNNLAQHYPHYGGVSWDINGATIRFNLFGWFLIVEGAVLAHYQKSTGIQWQDDYIILPDDNPHIELFTKIFGTP